MTAPLVVTCETQDGIININMGMDQPLYCRWHYVKSVTITAVLINGLIQKAANSWCTFPTLHDFERTWLGQPSRFHDFRNTFHDFRGSVSLSKFVNLRVQIPRKFLWDNAWKYTRNSCLRANMLRYTSSYCFSETGPRHTATPPPAHTHTQAATQYSCGCYLNHACENPGEIL